jgi:YggT family protein
VITVMAIDRGDVADYVETLVVVMVVLIFIRIIMSFIPRMPYNRWLDAFLSFVTQVTDPILNPIRRVMPMVKIGPGALDLSPMIATLLLFIVGGIVASLIRG